ncbi:MAG: hypothetical protein R2867_16120 [Caldilineaceae bacterium]
MADDIDQQSLCGGGRTTQPAAPAQNPIFAGRLLWESTPHSARLPQTIPTLIFAAGSTADWSTPLG